MAVLVHGARLIDTAGIVPDGWVHCEGDLISSTGRGDGWKAFAVDSELETIDAAGAWVTPGFVDLHVHGAGGWSFESGPAAVGDALAVHRAHGTTRTLLSLVSSPVQRLDTLLGELAAIVTADPFVLGVHLEGPFLAPTRRGAHIASALRSPDPAVVDRLLAAAGGVLTMMTVAPELPGGADLVRRLVDADIIAAVGHTEADYDQARSAFDAGARVLTHAFNAMAGLGHRAPGPVAAAFDDPRVTLELVNDGQHVDEAIIRLTFAAAPGRVALVTDAMAATGVGDGRYELGGRSVDVSAGVATVAGTSTLAGSTLTQDRALRNAVRAGVDPVAAVGAATTAPATALGLDDQLGLLRPGYAADLVVLDGDWRVRQVLLGGRPLPPAGAQDA